MNFSQSHKPAAPARYVLRSLVALATLLVLTGAHADERSDLEQLRATTMALIQAPSARRHC